MISGMARVQLAGVALAASAAVAIAAPPRKIKIETDPPGAKVYFNDTDSKPVCDKTPCTVDAPVGTTAVVIELDGYGPVIDSIEVPKKGKAGPFKFSLAKSDDDAEPAPAASGNGPGTIVIDAQSAKGAVVRIDDGDKGKVPVRIEVDPGKTYHVTVIKDGKKLYDNKDVKVEPGEERRISLKPGGGADPAPPPPTSTKSKPVATKDPLDGGGDDGEGSGSGSGDGGGEGSASDKPEIKKDQDRPERDRFIVVSGAVDVGFRRFTYSMGVGKYDSHYAQTEDGPTLAGIAVELWPAELAHASILRGLSLFGRFELPINHEEVLSAMGMGTGVSTNWGAYEGGARYHWAFGDSVGVEVGGSILDEKMSYSGTDPSNLPDAEYRSLNIHGRLSLLSLAPLEPYVVADGRILFAVGNLRKRFQTVTGDGYHLAVGAAVRSGAFSVRAEAAISAYNLALTNFDTATDTAQGATDRVIWLSVLAGIAY